MVSGGVAWLSVARVMPHPLIPWHEVPLMVNKFHARPAIAQKGQEKLMFSSTCSSVRLTVVCLLARLLNVLSSTCWIVNQVI